MSTPVQSFVDEHEAFAASRVSQYVYVPTRDTFFQVLDQHADTLEADIKPPLVLLGNEGSGKSALLSNWVAKRREHKHRDEFLFQHFVGCTTPSLQLAHTLFRLETALKDFFQLREMKVPDNEEELRWSLNRFLAAAAKKHSPARIVIIIDGVNRLKSEGAPDGQLLWLPTELPPCVRFIVSSVEFERLPTKGSIDIPQHRTYVELARRQCPMLRIEPLGVNTRHQVIQEFLKQNVDTVELSESQQFKIVTAPATSQPMYLRSLLQALRLASALTSATTDQLLETFLSCSSAHELIERNLNICCQEVFHESSNDASGDILGKMFSVVYVSRNGLTQVEILGVLKMVAKFNPDETTQYKMFSILKEFTMVVNEMHSFSHEIYREVVFSKYICTQEACVRWHYLMARFFGQLLPCDRKLVALPYHLEMAGSWSKVKNCLTEIEMFQLWWTPKFKGDFIKFWVSLVKQGNKKDVVKDTKKRGGGSGNDGPLQSRPSYDIVEEYAKSLDEYRNLRRPSDEAVSDIILEIADFLLEFAMLGHEALADVPNLIHPFVPHADLCGLGVPYLDADKEGKGELIYPALFEKLGKVDDGAGGGVEAPAKAGNDVPIEFTAYFFHRWMWIQFPYVALGNCSARFNEGIHRKTEATSEIAGRTRRTDDTTMDKKGHSLSGKEKKTGGGGGGGSVSGGSIMSKSWSAESFKLPEIKFARKARKTVTRLVSTSNDDVNTDKVGIRMQALRDDIQAYREEFDFVINMKQTLQRRLEDMKGAYHELCKSSESFSMFDDAQEKSIKREKDSVEKFESAKTLNRNLQNLVLVCERHPANVPALIHEHENKLNQDIFLLREIKKRLWEQRFERQAFFSTFRQMKSLIQDGADMHTKLLEYRYDVRKSLTQQHSEDSRRLNVGGRTSPTSENHHRSGKTRGKNEAITNGSSVEERSVVSKQQQNWEEIWSSISMRTGITEPEIFFQRMNNGRSLEHQIEHLKKQSEQKLEALKKEAVTVEQEMEEIRYNASVAGGQSSKDKQKGLADKQQELRHIKERSESTQQLVQRVESGLSHIGEMLGVEAREEECSAMELLKDIENALDTIIDEREKQIQQQQVQTGSPENTKSLVGFEKNAKTARFSPETDLLNISGTKTRVSSSKGLTKGPLFANAQGDSDDEGDDEDGMWDRQFVKLQSVRNLKMEQKRQARQLKLDGVVGVV